MHVQATGSMIRWQSGLNSTSGLKRVKSLRVQDRALLMMPLATLHVIPAAAWRPAKLRSNTASVR